MSSFRTAAPQTFQCATCCTLCQKRCARRCCLGDTPYLWLKPSTYEADQCLLINRGTVVNSDFNNGPMPRDYVVEITIAT